MAIDEFWSRKSLEQDIKRARVVSAIGREGEQQEIERTGKPWPVFVEDAKDYIRYFSPNLPDIASLPKRLAERKERGEKVLVVDICGVADAKV